MRVQIEVWSDVACPWCWVGKRHLEAALERFPHDVDVVWRAFELDPGAPKDAGPTDNVERLAKKYGTSRTEAQAMIDRMTSVGESVGLDFRFDRAQPSNTFDAHRLLHWAHGKGRQDELKEQLFLAYMHDGKSVADAEVLVDVAEKAGLDPDGARAVLGSDAHHDDVRQEELQARQLGITGVPFFVLNERFAVQGAQPAELILQALNKAWDETPLADAPVQGEACGPDGC